MEILGIRFPLVLSCVLEKDTFTPIVLVNFLVRKLWLCLDMIEKLLTGMFYLNTNEKSLVEKKFPKCILHHKSLSFSCLIVEYKNLT